MHRDWIFSRSKPLRPTGADSIQVDRSNLCRDFKANHVAIPKHLISNRAQVLTRQRRAIHYRGKVAGPSLKNIEGAGNKFPARLRRQHGVQAAPACLRQADDPVPAIHPDARRHQEHLHRHHVGGPVAVSTAARRRLGDRHFFHAHPNSPRGLAEPPSFAAATRRGVGSRISAGAPARISSADLRRPGAGSPTTGRGAGTSATPPSQRADRSWLAKLRGYTERNAPISSR